MRRYENRWLGVVVTVVLAVVAQRPAYASLGGDVTALSTQLEDDDYQVRQAACREMRRRAHEFMTMVPAGPSKPAGPGSMTSKLVHFFDMALDDPSENVVREAMAAAAQVPIHPVWAHLKQVIQRERGNFSSMTLVVGVNNFARMSKVLFPTQEAPVDALAVVILNDRAPAVRSAAAIGLASLKNPLGLDVLDAALASETNTFVLAVIRQARAQLLAATAGAP